MIVQVKERFQGEIQTAQLLLENESSVAGGVWDSLEEGTTVIAHLLDNPAERPCRFFRMMHGGVSAPSCCAFTHRVAFEEVSGHQASRRRLRAQSILTRPPKLLGYPRSPRMALQRG